MTRPTRALTALLLAATLVAGCQKAEEPRLPDYDASGVGASAEVNASSTTDANAVVEAASPKTAPKDRVRPGSPDEPADVAAFHRDFDVKDRFVYSQGQSGGQYYVLDRRNGCVYTEYHERTPIYGHDGKVDCSYRIDRVR